MKNVMVTGDLGDARVVHIERLQINITHVHDNGTNLNIQAIESGRARDAIREIKAALAETETVDNRIDTAHP